MPRIEFAEENKVVKTNFNFPKLKLGKGEKARIALVESPVYEYRHNLDAPVVINGKVELKTGTRADGTTYEDYKREFISAPLCSGDIETLAENGLDPDNCPVCKYIKANKGQLKAPQRRYAMHVIKYKTTAGSSKVATPFSVDLLVWAFTDKVFNSLADLKADWDLKTHDILLTCTNDVFQNYDIDVAPDAAWTKDAKTKSITEETFANNQIPDLSLACGTKKEERWLLDDLSKVEEAWAVVARVEGQKNGETPEVEESGNTASLADGVAELFGDKPEAPAEEASETPVVEKPATALGFADLL